MHHPAALIGLITAVALIGAGWMGRRTDPRKAAIGPNIHDTPAQREEYYRRWGVGAHKFANGMIIVGCLIVVGCFIGAFV